MVCKCLLFPLLHYAKYAHSAVCTNSYETPIIPLGLITSSHLCSNDWRRPQWLILFQPPQPSKLKSEKFLKIKNKIFFSSRLSLASSRQSLLGSRSQLVSPATERPVPTPATMTSSATDRTEKKSSISPPEFTSTSKRESFVEVQVNASNATIIDLNKKKFSFRPVSLKHFVHNLQRANHWRHQLYPPRTN